MKNINKFKWHTDLNIGLIMLLIPIVLGVFAPLISNLDIDLVDSANRLKSINALNWMGTDNLGRDVFTRTIYGIRVSLFIGVLVTALSLVTGIIIGIYASYFKRTGDMIMRLLDGIMAFPTIILAITMAGILGSGVPNIIIALTVSYFPTFVRITRERVIAVKKTDYVESAVAIGKGNAYIIRNYIIPNIIAPLIVQATFIFAMAILNESILSFLGVGLKVPMPSLGGMVSDGRNYMMIAPWIIMFPGLIISLIVFSINLIGDGLRDVLDPQSESI
ncbi:ABC transporter permease [Helicovermis profundi]|uniref:ABC transporter permease n=1 Tax=Helicovermis profundi TaxID=3065157 RepID=A0AAU9E8P8_9FIRM|nr:ABC transporter permease [Clostridia bacterium S502]